MSAVSNQPFLIWIIIVRWKLPLFTFFDLIRASEIVKQNFLLMIEEARQQYWGHHVLVSFEKSKKPLTF